MSEPPNAGAQDIATLSFEQALAELEQIVARPRAVRRRWRPRSPCTKAARRLKAHCETRLEAARLRVEKIVVGAGGAPGVEPAEFS